MRTSPAGSTSSSPGTGVRAFVPGDVIGWAAFGLVFGGIAGLAGGGGVLGFAEHAVVTGILWGLFGLVAGTLYALWAGRSISARRMKPLDRSFRPTPRSRSAGPKAALSHDRIAEWSTPATDQLIMRFNPWTAARSSGLNGADRRGWVISVSDRDEHAGDVGELAAAAGSGSVTSPRSI